MPSLDDQQHRRALRASAENNPAGSPALLCRGLPLLLGFGLHKRKIDHPLEARAVSRGFCLVNARLIDCMTWPRSAGGLDARMTATVVVSAGFRTPEKAANNNTMSDI